MKLRLFLDTNVLLDILLERPGYEPMLDSLLSGPDFEDILQAVCAAAAGCQVIVTHNTKHFAIQRALADDWTLPEILTPETFLLK